MASPDTLPRLPENSSKGSRTSFATLAFAIGWGKLRGAQHSGSGGIPFLIRSIRLTRRFCLRMRQPLGKSASPCCKFEAAGPLRFNSSNRWRQPHRRISRVRLAATASVPACLHNRPCPRRGTLPYPHSWHLRSSRSVWGARPEDSARKGGGPLPGRPSLAYVRPSKPRRSAAVQPIAEPPARCHNVRTVPDPLQASQDDALVHDIVLSHQNP